MIIINLVPHAVTILSPRGFDLVTIPASTAPARIDERTIETETIAVSTTDRTRNGIVSTGVIEQGPITGLPDPEPDTIYIVSRPVALHPDTAGRRDLYVPDDLVRDAEGRVTGCRRISRITTVGAPE